MRLTAHTPAPRAAIACGDTLRALPLERCYAMPLRASHTHARRRYRLRQYAPPPPGMDAR